MSAIRWLLGNRAGTVVEAWWGWLWGQPIKQGGTIAVAAAENALQERKEKVRELASGIAAANAKLTQFKNTLESNLQEVSNLKSKANSLRDSNREAAIIAATKARALHGSNQTYKEAIFKLEKQLEAMKDALSVQRAQLVEMETQQEASEAKQQIAAALQEVDFLGQEFGTDLSQSTFDEATQAIDLSYLTSSEEADMALSGNVDIAALQESSVDDILAGLD